MTRRKIAASCIALLFVGGLFWLAIQNRRPPATMTYSEFLDALESHRVAGVVLHPDTAGAVAAVCTLRDGEVERTVLPLDYQSVLKTMREQNVRIEIQDWSNGPIRLLTNAAPFFVLLGIWLFLMARGFPNGTRPGMWS